MSAKLDLIYPRSRTHANPKLVVRFVFRGKTNPDWVFGLSPYALPAQVEDGMLNRACEIASCTMVRKDLLDHVEARVVHPETAEVYAEYRYSAEDLTFKRIK